MTLGEALKLIEPHAEHPLYWEAVARLEATSYVDLPTVALRIKAAFDEVENRAAYDEPKGSA